MGIWKWVHIVWKTKNTETGFDFNGLFCVSLTGCTKIYNGTDELTEKARKEMPVSDFKTTDIQYAGMSVADNKALAWFISGNEYQAHYYLPMEVEVKDDR